MSTRFTKNRFPLTESETLRLTLASSKLHERCALWVVSRLSGQGFEDLTPALLRFLGALDCGVNQASEIADRLQVSRQMVAKSVRELSERGYLERAPGKGRRKQILFTKRGEWLMSSVRQELAKLDVLLASPLGEGKLAALAEQLESIGTLISEHQ